MGRPGVTVPKCNSGETVLIHAGNQQIVESFVATAIDYRKSSVEEYVAAHTRRFGF
jgi:hypothetical protein